MLGLTALLTLLTAVGPSPTTATTYDGSIVPCKDGAMLPNPFHETYVHCNTSASHFEHHFDLRLHEERHQTFNSCVNACFGYYVGGECCGAQYNKETKVCQLIDYGGSVCSISGKRLVGASNDTTNLVVVHRG